jgi:hypothetical protein
MTSSASRLLLVLLSAASSLSCGNTSLENGGTTGVRESPTINVILRNVATDGQFIHIFGADETNTISNRLQPGEQRNYPVDNFTADQTEMVRFTAGRNFGLPSELRDLEICILRSGTVPKNREVQWNGTTLSCVGW